jgi:ankyrin repeat protein
MYQSRFISNTGLITDLAHARGATALHFAARLGHVHHGVWLLKHGAHLSLRVRNKLGCTPIDVARIFGPFPDVEALLGAAILNKNFHLQYVVAEAAS